MQVNSTASYAPSYNANYAAVQQSRRMAQTKVTAHPSANADAPTNHSWQAKTDTQLVDKVGLRLDVKV